jgi:hypothetical protein
VSPDYPQTPDELETALAEQLDHIRASCERFDSKVHSEAKRIAVSIRVLLYDSGRSRSVLQQLGRKGIQFFDSARDLDPANLADHWGLVVMISPNSPLPAFVSPLDGPLAGPGRWLDFDSWWGAVVFRDAEGRQITRGGLILAVANQDGGAHVDPSLDAVYAALSRQNSLGWTKVHADGSTTPADPPHLHAVRQIGHEMLRTFDPQYTKRLSLPLGTAVAAGLRIVKTPKPVFGAGRNDPCPCGSGKKFKKCHAKPGAADGL